MNTSGEQMVQTSLSEKAKVSDVDAYFDNLPDAEGSNMSPSSPQCNSPGGTLIKRRNTTRPQRQSTSPRSDDTDSNSSTPKKEKKKEYLTYSFFS